MARFCAQCGERARPSGSYRACDGTCTEGFVRFDTETGARLGPLPPATPATLSSTWTTTPTSLDRMVRSDGRTSRHVRFE